MIPRAPRSLHVRRRATERWSTRRRFAFSGSLLVVGILALELTALFNLYRRRRSLLGPRVVLGAGNVAGPFVAERPATNNHEARYADRVAEYGARLRELERRIRTVGATPVFVTQPRGDYRWIDRRVYAASPAAMDQYLILQLFNRRTLEVCREAGAICIDLAAGLHFSDGDFYDVMHTTPQGSRKIGEYLAAELGQAL